MLDTRDISYTQGSPLTPVHEGVLLPTADPFPGIAKGEVISRAKTQPRYPKVTLQSPIPLPIMGQFPYVEFDGITPTGFGIKPIQELFAEPKPEEVILYPSPFIPIEPKIGEDVSEEAIESMTEVLGETPGTPFPVTQPISLTVPEIKWPDLSGLKDVLIIAGVALGGLFLIGKFIGRKT